MGKCELHSGLIRSVSEEAPCQDVSTLCCVKSAPPYQSQLQIGASVIPATFVKKGA